MVVNSLCFGKRQQCANPLSGNMAHIFFRIFGDVLNKIRFIGKPGAVLLVSAVVLLTSSLECNAGNFGYEVRKDGNSRFVFCLVSDGQELVKPLDFLIGLKNVQFFSECRSKLRCCGSDTSDSLPAISEYVHKDGGTESANDSYSRGDDWYWYASIPFNLFLILIVAGAFNGSSNGGVVSSHVSSPKKYDVNRWTQQGY